ncbi:hypothetical protein [Streptomyces sp. NPDC091209]|uniref:hypothetical protein n=1 Tax=Streptomyces sp. NPDC091209 TaxID=3365974 RepID=UPI003819A5E8
MSTTTVGDRPGSPGPRFDEHDHVPELVPLRKATGKADWDAVQACFEALDSAEKASFASGIVAGTDGIEGFLRRAAARLPGEPLPRTLLADHYVRVGWGIRGRAQAAHVSREQFDRFHGCLERAEQILIEVCGEHPSYAHAWTVRLITARGLELGRAEARRRYDRLCAHHPHHYPAQAQLLQQLCPKWGGSWEAAHGFAQEAVAAAPAGSHSGALVAHAHLEHWLVLDGASAATYLRDVAVRNDLRRAAQASVLHPDHRPGWYGLGAHNAFAMAFSLGGHHADAAPHFRELGDRPTEFPWHYLPHRTEAFVTYRNKALAKG